MAIEGVDYSSARPDPKCLYQAGKRFAVRYTSIGEHRKNITLGEADRLTDAGLRLGTGFEESAGGMLGGTEAGVRDAKASLAMGQAAGTAAACDRQDENPVLLDAGGGASGSEALRS